MFFTIIRYYHRCRKLTHGLGLLSHVGLRTLVDLWLLHPVLDLDHTWCHWHPSTGLLADLALLGLLPTGPGHLVGGHEGTGLSDGHKVVSWNHVGVGWTNEASGHSLGSDGVLGG